MWQVLEDLGPGWRRGLDRGWGGGRGCQDSPRVAERLSRRSRSRGQRLVCCCRPYRGWAGRGKRSTVATVRIRWLAAPGRHAPGARVTQCVGTDSSHLPRGDGDWPDRRDHRQGVANRILDVRPNAIVRASDEARTPDGQGAPVTRRWSERIWHALASRGHASRISGMLFFAYALVAEIPGVAVDNDRRGLHIADWDLAMTPYQEGIDVRRHYVPQTLLDTCRSSCSLPG